MLQHVGRDVCIAENALSNTHCEALIKIYEDDFSRRDELSKESNDYGNETNYTRCIVSENLYPKMFQFFIHQIKQFVNEYKSLLGLNVELGSRYEPLEMLKFEKGKGKFDLHFDSNADNHNRNLAMIWYLNTVEKGGRLILPSRHEPITVQPTAGKLVIMPCDWMHYHHVTTTESDSRYSMMTFLCF